MTAARSDTQSDLVRVSQADLDRFHRNAPAALARRGRAYALEEAASALPTILFGGLPIVGILYWGWSPAELFLFLLAGAWIGIACDTVKVFALRRRAEAFAAAMYDDWHVWVVVQALRDKSNKAPASHLSAKWNPMGGVFVDFVMGGISTALIITLLVAEAGLQFSTFQTTGLAIGIGVMALLRVVSTAWELLHHRASDRARDERQGEWVEQADGDRPVKVVVGLRGVGLFLLMFLVVFLTDDGSASSATVTRICMLVVNCLLVLWGVTKLFTPLLIRGETKWLRAYLAERANQQPPTNRPAPTIEPSRL